MTKLNRKLWMGLLIPITMTVAGVVGGIEWVFASLGAMVLIGMAGISIYVLTKVRVTYSQSAEAGPISKKDERLIMEHIGELFEMGSEQSREKLAVASPISKKDKRLIMEHISELFETGWEQTQEMLS